jgi:hypothetical protein
MQAVRWSHDGAVACACEDKVYVIKPQYHSAFELPQGLGDLRAKQVTASLYTAAAPSDGGSLGPAQRLAQVVWARPGRFQDRASYETSL